jgi:N-acetyl-1-D-myo-inositol-2-amino-2-deoxy-alpha-D-glucopyranoside deacetylase
VHSTADRRRLLLVHAHPDDEAIGTGATMARYAAEGALVTLVTCTLGEEGEILVPSLTQLAADQADQLGGYRIGELAAALRELGVSDHRFLGGAGCFRDSGMMGSPVNDKPRAFWRADAEPAVFARAVALLAEIIREVRPQVLVTYDDFGGYGHPDHIMAHRVATAAVDAAGCVDPLENGREPWQVGKLYWTAMPRRAFAARFDAIKALPDSPFARFDSVDDAPFLVEDDLVTTAIDGQVHASAKRRAMAAHRTQISLDGHFFALADNVGQQLSGVEYYRLVRGELGPRGIDGREDDLFGGLTL